MTPDEIARSKCAGDCDEGYGPCEQCCLRDGYDPCLAADEYVSVQQSEDVSTDERAIRDAREWCARNGDLFVQLTGEELIEAYAAHLARSVQPKPLTEVQKVIDGLYAQVENEWNRESRPRMVEEWSEIIRELEAALAATPAPEPKPLTVLPANEAQTKLLRAALAATPAPEAKPVPMLLDCPNCHSAHIDDGEWATRPHKRHLCNTCEHQWRPANIATVGVLTLPYVPTPKEE